MARPQKQTVDYFPHDTDASDGKTLTIIQAKYGNDGYAFWFKLLQLLGKASGHYYDFNNPADWEFLLAKTHQNDKEKAKDILKTLSILGAIDSELYAHGVIWCQKFVDRVADAYNRTVGGAPKRPDFLVNVGNKGVNVGNKGVSVNRLNFKDSRNNPSEPEVDNFNDPNAHQKGTDKKAQKGVNVESNKVSVLKSGQSVSRNPKNTTETPQTKLKETKLNKESKERKAETLSQRFGIFWKAYPRKIAKLNAEKVFTKINPDEKLLATMLATIERAKKSEGWLKEDGKYIPHPATWLNGKRWEDEYPEKGGQGGKDRVYFSERSKKTTDEERLASLNPEQRRQQKLDG